MQVDGALERYLKTEILPQIASPPYGLIDAFQVSTQRPVFIYHDQSSHAKIIGKYHKYGAINLEEAWRKAEREYFNLTLLRDKIGMKNNHYNIIAPLGRNKVLSALLILENAEGHNLDHYINHAIHDDRSKELFFKLKDLAHFFHRLHHNSDAGRQVSSVLPRWYLDTIVNALKTSLNEFYNQEKEIKLLGAAWWNREEAFRDHEVIVHGDATPTNFLFHQDRVTGIDLEKMKWADRCWDLGFIAAELKHHFMWRTGDGTRAEPFIGHFLWEYASAYHDNNLFYNITRRLPLYMALGHLRIARNTWLDEKYRYQLVGEAKLCLKFRP